jgi:hypothetical protein
MSTLFEPRPFREYRQPEPRRRNYEPASEFCVCMSTRLKTGRPEHDRPGPEPKETKR